MSNSLKRIALSTALAIIIFAAAYVMNGLKVHSATPAHRILTLDYKAESAVTQQMKDLRYYPEKIPVPTELETLPNYTISLQPAKSEHKRFYRIILSSPGKQRLVQLTTDPTSPDVFDFH